MFHVILELVSLYYPLRTWRVLVTTRERWLRLKIHYSNYNVFDSKLAVSCQYIFPDSPMFNLLCLHVLRPIMLLKSCPNSLSKLCNDQSQSQKTNHHQCRSNIYFLTLGLPDISYDELIDKPGHGCSILLTLFLKATALMQGNSLRRN